MCTPPPCVLSHVGPSSLTPPRQIRMWLVYLHVTDETPPTAQDVACTCVSQVHPPPPTAQDVIYMSQVCLYHPHPTHDSSGCVFTYISQVPLFSSGCDLYLHVTGASLHPDPLWQIRMWLLLPPWQLRMWLVLTCRMCVPPPWVYSDTVLSPGHIHNPEILQWCNHSLYKKIIIIRLMINTSNYYFLKMLTLRNSLV